MTANHAEKILEVRGLTKTYGGEAKKGAKQPTPTLDVLKGIDIDIYRGDVVCLIGPSGCGKTTTLRMIGGFETPDQGDILFLSERINDIPPHKRNINTVFQRYALFPHLNVFENVAFPLREQKLPRDEIEQKVNEMLALVKLTGFERRNVTRLSGGQQQRVAIARALVNNPSVIIADEPTGNLDPARSLEIMMLLEQINALGTTVLVVTHERELVNRFTKRVVAINEGRIISDGMDGYYLNEEE